MLQITESAKKLIQEAMTSQKCDTLKMSLERSCCGTSIRLDLVNASDGDHTMNLDGIQVMMDDATKDWTDEKLFDTQNGRLVIQNLGGCCCC